MVQVWAALFSDVLTILCEWVSVGVWCVVVQVWAALFANVLTVLCEWVSMSV